MITLSFFLNSLWRQTFQKCQEAVRPGNPEFWSLDYKALHKTQTFVFSIRHCTVPTLPLMKPNADHISDK